MRTAQLIVKRPLLTEKSTQLRETGGRSDAPAEPGEEVEYGKKIVFEVARDANKIEIREAIEKLFNVTVTSVRTQVSRGKMKRVGRFSGRRPGLKKAIVTLKPGDNIEFFEGV
jgi:large subunit ribosomal protein L23